MRKKVLNIASLILVLLFMLSLTASAQTDSAGNSFVSDSDPALQTVERDLYWVGSSRVFDGYQIGKSFLAAGRDITLNESTVGGSLRAGAFSITLNGVDVTDNITAAGYNVQASGVTASGVYLAGSNLYFSGTADSANLAGQNVTLDGEIRGDANIYANKIIFGENLLIDGTLTVHSGSEPAIPSGAKVGNYVFEKDDSVKEINVNVDSEGTHIEVKETVDVKETGESTVEIKKSTTSRFGSFLRGLAGQLLLSVLLCLMLGGQELRKPGKMLLERPFPMLGSGFAGLFVIPGIILVLLFIGFGFPSAGLLGLLFAVVCIYALIFTGMTLANTLIPRFTDNKTLANEWVCSLIGALVFWLLRKIPVFGFILQIAAVIYTLGYFIQVIFLRLKGSVKSQKPEIKPVNDDAQTDTLEPVIPEYEAADDADILESKVSDPEK
ncbi:MAG: hypothetical protein IJI57_05305 [Flexilinea sp.]|nr:hypothetical protein [Flexilinea sp.]